MDRVLPTDAVGERSEEKLPDSQPDEQGRDDELDVVRMRHAEVAAHDRQRREHAVGRQGDERHQQGDERNEFGGTKGRPGADPVHPSVSAFIAKFPALAITGSPRRLRIRHCRLPEAARVLNSGCSMSGRQGGRRGSGADPRVPPAFRASAAPAGRSPTAVRWRRMRCDPRTTTRRYRPGRDT